MRSIAITFCNNSETKGQKASDESPKSRSLILTSRKNKTELREEQKGFRDGRGCVDPNFTLRLVIERLLSYRAPLVLNFIYYE